MPDLSNNGWWHWIERARAQHATVQHPDPSIEAFLAHYRAHQPCVINLPSWPAFQWTLPYLRARAGHAQVQVQTGRLTDPNYETQSSRHRSTMSFSQFIDLVEHGADNDAYMTAQNSESHRAFTRLLANDMRPMPAMFTDQPESAFLWIGKNTLTPLHHDVTDNTMCQIRGSKQVRMVAPEYWRQVDHRQGVHTGIDWITDEVAQRQGFPYREFWINPGQMLYLPVGWWHCVQAYGTSITAVFTNFVWGNDNHTNFTPITK